ncbi:MAG: TolC family protein [Oligoflexales bacterium]|nr:TolC family protein [Oligoflexales bacterium]
MKKSVFIILFYTLIANVTVAQTPPSNAELTTLVNQAFTNYPRLREQEIAVENASLRVDIVRGQYLPTVSADGSIRYIDPVAEASFGAPGQEQILRFQPKDNYNAQIGANGLIFDFGKTKAQVDKALAEAKLSQDNLAQFRGMIAYQVAQIYYGILFSKKSIEVQQSQIGALEDNRQQVEIRVKNGDALELDLLNANVALENARNRLTDLQAQLEKQQIPVEISFSAGAFVCNRVYYEFYQTCGKAVPGLFVHFPFLSSQAVGDQKRVFMSWDLQKKAFLEILRFFKE